jgi:hypothetical protein
MRYLIGCDARWINKVAPAFQTPALRKQREERATHFIGDARQIKGWDTL